MDISKAFSGSVHDFEIFKNQLFNPSLRRFLRLMRGVIIWGDSAYIALIKLYPDWESHIHDRASRNHPLSAEQKMNNKIKSKIRILIEHTIARMKKYRCCLDRVRNMRPEKQTRYWHIVAGLCNLRKIEELDIKYLLRYSQQNQCITNE